MSDLLITKANETYIRVDSSEDSILMELSEFFTFDVPGAKYMPAYKAGWDGKLRLFNRFSRQIYAGLLPHIEAFAKEREYSFYPESLRSQKEPKVTYEHIEKVFQILNLHAAGKPIQARDYQIEAVTHAINKERCLLLSPTASGKSAIIYGLIRHYLIRPECAGKKILVVVPTTSLVEQMYSDFAEYSSVEFPNFAEKYCHKIYSGKEKITNKRVIITTWQSIYNLPRTWFSQFKVLVGDEAHNFQAKSLTKIVEKLTDCQFRIGTSGTLQDTKTHRLVLEGLFGQVYTVTTTKELMDNGTVASAKFHCLCLKYPEETCKELAGAKYQDELEYLVTCAKRNDFIAKLAVSLKGNTLVLFNFIEHGKKLTELIKGLAKKRKVIFIFGGTEVEQREALRTIIERETDAIVVASYGTYSTGVNIRALHNIVFGSPSKSRIRNLQSIGRGLRKGETKTFLNVYDISDDLSHKKSKNHTLKHFLYRIQIYNEEGFDFRIINIPLGHKK